MKTSPLLLASIIAVAGLLTGCAGSTPKSQPVEKTKPLADNVKILGKITGNQLKTNRYKLMVVDRASFTKLGLAELFADSGVEVDLDKHSVILLALSEQATGGYSADITALQIKGQELYIQTTSVAPGPNDMVTQALTYPFCAVAVDKLPAGLTLHSDNTSLP